MAGDSGDDVLGDTAAATPASVASGKVTPIVRAGGGARLAAGARIGRYVIVEHLGSGGMGAVYRARDPELGRDLAVKVLHPHLADQRARLLREGQAIARLVHPNVVTIHDVGAHDGGLFIAMEYVDGTDLRRWLTAAPRTPADILAKFVLAGHGLSAAHAAGLVHRDFKPDNVLVNRTTGRTIVTDFGLARAGGSHDAPTDAPTVSPDTGLTQTGALAGTPLYMAPEQFTGDPLTPACDQFSFCVALYEALYGKRPFTGTTLDAIMIAVTTTDPTPPPARANIPDAVRGALARGLARDPAERHPSMTALVDALAAAGKPRRRFRAIAIAAVFAAVGGGALVVKSSLDTAEKPPTHVATGNPLDPCNAAVARIDAIWTPAARDAIAHRDATLSEAKDDVAQIDHWVEDWRAIRGKACRDHADASAACLEGATHDLEAALAPPATADVGDIISMLWLPLPALDRCGPNPTPPASVRDLHEPVGKTDVVAIAPDGAHYAITRDGSLHVVDLAAKTERAVVAPPGWQLHGWRDATHVVGATATATAFTTIDIATGAVAAFGRMTPDILAADRSFSRVVTHTKTGLAIATVDGSAPDAALDESALAAASPYITAAWSPDGKRIAAAIRNPDSGTHYDLVVYTLGAEVQTERHPLRGARDARGHYELAWLDDHRLLLGARRTLDPDLWLVALDHFSVRHVLHEPVHAVFANLQSAGGRVLAMQITTRDSTSQLVGGALKPIPRGADTDPACATADGKHLIVYRAGRAEAIALADGAALDLGPGGVTPHGAGLVIDRDCTEPHAGCVVERAALDGPDTEITLPAPYNNLVCSAATCLALAHTPTTTTFARRQTDGTLGPARTIDLTLRDPAQIQPSPDGKRAAIVYRFGADRLRVEVLALDGTAPPETWLGSPIPHCATPQWVAWRDNATVVASLECDDGGVVVETTGPHATPRRLFTSPTKIPGIAVAGGAIYVGQHAFEQQLVELDDLAARDQ